MIIKRWVRDAEDPYGLRAEMSDGRRTAKIDLLPVLADFLSEIDLSGINAAVAEAMGRSASPW